jgi:hypothetical protein
MGITLFLFFVIITNKYNDFLYRYFITNNDIFISLFLFYNDKDFRYLYFINITTIVIFIRYYNEK